MHPFRKRREAGPVTPQQAAVGWGYAVFSHGNATGKMVAEAAKADCGHTCHVAVKSKDYVFQPYRMR